MACRDNGGAVVNSICYEAVNGTATDVPLDVSAEASTIFSQYLLVAGLTSIITLALLGRGVDVLGRRFPLYLSMIGTALSCFAFLAFNQLGFKFAFFMIPAVLQGLSGGGPGFALSMWTMTADISERENRVANFAYMEASIFIGNLIGTLIAGQLLGAAGINATLIFTISLTLVVSVFGYFFLRNMPRHASLEVNDKIQIVATGGAAAAEGGTTDAKLSSNGATSYMGIAKDMLRRSWWTRGKLNVVIFLSGFALAYTIFNLTPAFLQYLPHINPIFWDPSTVGLFLSSQWLCRSIYLIVTPIILHRFFAGAGSKRDVWVVRIALLSYTVACVLYGVITNEIAYFFINLIDGFGCLAVVTCRGLILHSVENPDLFGKIGSLIAIVETAVTLASPPLFTIIFGITVDAFDGTVFMVAASFTGLAFLLTVFVDTRAVDAAHHHQQEEGFADDSVSAPLLKENNGGASEVDASAH